MEAHKSTNTSRKKERARLYRKKIRNIHGGRQYRLGRVNRLRHAASKCNDKLLDITSHTKVLEKIINKTTAHNKLLQR